MTITKGKVRADIVDRVLWDSSYDTREEAADEIERLREALKETLAVAKRNEIGDYIQRAEALLQQKEAE